MIVPVYVNAITPSRPKSGESHQHVRIPLIVNGPLNAVDLFSSARASLSAWGQDSARGTICNGGSAAWQ